ncbi:hypothetical protein [Photobacterium leiognathi]|uniref:hypothetical protein n=1 Tax=Photobacterium leiognathi TaxID=553611 RepID=UPI002735D02B|nr:hypothetical protein [Photobacterium leiognathi]
MNFSKREWIFLILLLSLIQGFVWYAAFVNASNGSALNFISFAGTLISIILAILAIGYTYGESITQKNQSDTVVNQIEKLNTAIDTINKQTSNFNQIKEISDTLLKYTELVEHKMNNTHDEVSNIKNLLSDIVTVPNVKINKSNDVNTSSNTDFNDIKNIRYTYSEIVFLSLIYCEGKHFEDTVSNDLFEILNKVDFHDAALDKKKIF